MTYVVFSDVRPWTSADGRTIQGRLIAFEEVVTLGKAGAPPSATPEMPATATVVRDGHVRLLVNGRASVVPLERLAEADRAFIEQIRLERAKSDEAKKK